MSCQCSQTKLDSLWESDELGQPLVIHVSQKVEPSLVAGVVLLVVQHVQGDECGEQPREHQRVEQTIACECVGGGGRGQKLKNLIYILHTIYITPDSIST